jgi:hypothetical protein
MHAAVTLGGGFALCYRAALLPVNLKTVSVTCASPVVGSGPPDLD